MALIQTSTVSNFYGDSGSGGASITLGTAVTAANCLIAVVSAYRLSTSSGELLTAITDNKSNTWVLVGKSVASDVDTNHRTAVYIYAAYNVASGSTTVSLDATYEDDTTYFGWAVTEWSALATSAAADKTSSGTVESPATSLSTGSTATLAQANELVIAAMAGPYVYAINSVGGAGSPPSGYTLIAGQTGNITIPTMPFQAVYKTVTDTAAVSAAWTIPSDAGELNAAVIATFKPAVSTALRVTVDVTDGVAGETGIEAHVWTARPDQGVSTRYTGSAVTITGSAGSYKLKLSPAPAGTVNLQSVNVVAFNTLEGTGYVTGTVETV